jgi:hypothetical protein
LIKALAQLDEVDEACLTATIDRVNAPRHGRGASGVVTDGDVELLRRLDGHPALGELSNENLDRHWALGTINNEIEWHRAEEYLALLDQEEVERRATAIASHFEFDRYEAKGDNVAQDCDLRGHETMNIESAAEVSGGPMAGTCLLCSYRRSSAIADEQSMSMELVRLMEKDD